MYAGGGMIIEVRLLCCVPGPSWKPGCGQELADAAFKSFAFILSLAGLRLAVQHWSLSEKLFHTTSHKPTCGTTYSGQNDKAMLFATAV